MNKLLKRYLSIDKYFWYFHNNMDYYEDSTFRKLLSKR